MVYGYGVFFVFLLLFDIGLGLMFEGKDLVCECNILCILLDLLYLNEKGFDDIVVLFDVLLVVSYSCVYVVVFSLCNLIDWQFCVIVESWGFVGLNYVVGFLYFEGWCELMQGFDIMLCYLDYLLVYLGEDGVVLGLDYDGVQMFEDILDVLKLQNLI